MKKIFERFGLVGIFKQLSSFQAVSGTANDYTHPIQSSSSGNFYRKIKKFYKNSVYLPFIIVGLIVVVIAYFAVRNLAKTPSGSVAGTSDQKINLQNAKASQAINKEFLFSIKDANGKEISKLKYAIQNAELRDEIIIKGQKATAVAGRTFLVLNLKITNDYNKAIQINARDYVRLMINNSPDKLAPDIHNDPVEIQAISTKLTRLGFPINETDRNLTLQVGEIDGAKEFIKLNLK